MLKHHFVPAKAQGKVTCGECGRSFPVTVPMVPKSGAQLTFRTACSCGNQITVTLTGRGTDPIPAARGP